MALGYWGEPRSMSDDIADLIIVDGRGVLWRSSYSNAKLGYAGPDGWQPTGGVYGFLESVLSLAYRHEGASVYVAWEGFKSREVRRRELPSYKQRDDSDDDRARLAKLVIKQEAILKGVLKSTGWTQVQANGWEADDAIATIAEKGYREGLQSLVLSSDADLFQTLREPDVEYPGWVRVHKPNGKKGTLWTEPRLSEEWGISPEQIPDVKALSGDASDNYKGIPGIGHKWACKIVKEYGDLFGVIEHAKKNGEICGSNKKAKDLLENEKYAISCLKVAIANASAKVKMRRGEASKKELRSILGRLRFNSLNNDRAIGRMLTR